jgi:tetratricopeptide (TPR) repeat protein
MVHDPSVEQWIARGKEAYARNAYLEALAALQEAAALQPGFADVQNLTGLCLSLLGRPEEAVAAFQKAVATNPAYVEAQLNLAITLNDLGRFDEARVAFERAAGADVEQGSGPFPSAAAARLANKHAELGDLYAEAGAPERALEQYREATALRPQFLDIRNKLARTVLELGDAAAAEEELRKVLEMRPAFVAARANLGLALFRRGEVDGAEAEWRRCLAQQPGNAQVAAYLGMLERRREHPAE